MMNEPTPVYEVARINKTWSLEAGDAIPHAGEWAGPLSTQNGRLVGTGVDMFIQCINDRNNGDNENKNEDNIVVQSLFVNSFTKRYEKCCKRTSTMCWS